MSNDDISPRLGRYMAKMLGIPAVEIDGLSRISGGASRETYRFAARYYRDGRAHDRRLILRRDPPASLIDTERANEFRAYKAFHKLGLPVPEKTGLVRMLQGLGQVPFDPPNVKGWLGGESWITTYTLLLRQQFLRRMIEATTVASMEGGMMMAPISVACAMLRRWPRCNGVSRTISTSRRRSFNTTSAARVSRLAVTPVAICERL